MHSESAAPAQAHPTRGLEGSDPSDAEQWRRSSVRQQQKVPLWRRHSQKATIPTGNCSIVGSLDGAGQYAQELPLGVSIRLVLARTVHSQALARSSTASFPHICPVAILGLGTAIAVSCAASS